MKNKTAEPHRKEGAFTLIELLAVGLSASLDHYLAALLDKFFVTFVCFQVNSEHYAVKRQRQILHRPITYSLINLQSIQSVYH